MVLCPYVFLLTHHDIPPLRLQPTEVGSIHWVSLRALLSPEQRTYELQDVSNRLAKQEMGIGRWFLRMMLGRMLFAAVRLIPSESMYCSSIPGFIPASTSDADNSSYSLTARVKAWWKGETAGSTAPDKPLLLWGLTLGVVADLLELLPPYDALDLWEFPTFTPWDVRFTLWAMSYQFRKRKRQLLASYYVKAPIAVEEGLESVAAPNESSDDSTSEEDKPGEVGIGGLGVGRYYGKIRSSAKGSRSSSVGTLLEGYYDIVQKAVAVALVGRVSVVALLVATFWIRYRKRRMGL